MLHTVSPITFGSQVIWQYKMDLFPVAVRGSAIISCGRTAGGSEYKFWSFCNTQFGTLYCVLITRTQDPDSVKSESEHTVQADGPGGVRLST